MGLREIVICCYIQTPYSCSNSFRKRVLRLCVTMRSLSSVYINQKLKLLYTNTGKRREEIRRKGKNVKHTLILLTFIQPVVYSILYVHGIIHICAISTIMRLHTRYTTPDDGGRKCNEPYTRT